MDIDEPVTVRDHDPSWAERGRQYRRSIESLCQDLGVEVEHIGSTSVPGLASKPVIDIQVGAPSAQVEEAVVRLSTVGFEHVPDAGVEGREYLRRRGAEAANVHIVARGGALWNDNILFRDYLRSHRDAARSYERAKREAAAAHPHLLAYSAAKAAVVLQILADARQMAESDPITGYHGVN